MSTTLADLSSTSQAELRRTVYTCFASACLLLPLLFFAPAGT